MIDQHFNQKGRFGRTIVSALESNDRYAIGIDERTAIIVNGDKKEFEIIGEHGITIFDFMKIEKSKGYLLHLKGIQISYLENGDKFNWETNTFILSERKSNKITNPCYQPKPSETKPFSPYKLKELPVNQLVINEAKETTAIATKNFYIDSRDFKNDCDTDGFRLTFRKQSLPWDFNTRQMPRQICCSEC